MKIALFSDTYFPIINGISVSVYLLATELRQQGHSVTIFTNDHDKAQPEKGVIRLKAMKPPVRALREFRIGRVTKKKLLTVMETRYDVIHCHTELTMGRLGKRVAKLTNTPLIYTYHTMYEDYVHYISKYFQGLSRKFVIYYSVRFANASTHLIAPTQKVADKFHSYGYKGPLTIIPTGIDLNKFKSESLDKTLLNQLKESFKRPFPHGVFVGRVSHEKNLKTLLLTLKACIEEKTPWYLTIIGDGPAKKDCEALVKEQGLSSYVRFTGMVAPEMIPYYYQLSDFFVSFSTTETQGLTYIEALAANLPVIAQDDVHLSSMIEEGVSGYLIPSPAAFNPLMASIIEIPDRLKKLSPEHSKLLAPLSSKAYANNILKIYQAAISKSPS